MNQTVEVINKRLLWCCDRQIPNKPKTHAFCIDESLVYLPYNTDFGPLDLSMIFKYCSLLDELLQRPSLQKHSILHFTCMQPSKRANSAFLICAYQILRLNRTAEEAWSLFDRLPRFLFFRDASTEGSSFELHIFDCLQALSRGKSLNWFDLDSFNLQDYEKYSNPDNGGFNWLVPNKFLAFSNPITRNNQRGLTAEQYSELFKSLGVKAVIRLNNPTYEASRFKKNGLNHYEMFFEDGSVPSNDVVNRFLQVASREEVIAVHCQAGLGRTATLVGCFVIKEFGFTGLEAIAWCRLCRSGSVLGPQQHFLCDYYERTNGGIGRSVCLTPYEQFKAEFGDVDQGARLTAHSVREDYPPAPTSKYKTKFNQMLKIDPQLLKLYSKK